MIEARRKPGRLLRDRRGVELGSETAARLAIVVLVVVVIILISANLIHSLKSASSFEACQKSIAIAHKNYGNLLMRGKYALDCDPVHLVLTMDDAIREADKIGRADMPGEGVKSLLAGEMVRCWRMVSKGEFNPFGQQLDNSFCLICSVIDFGDELKQEGSVSGFHTFLERESAKIEGVEQQYGSFLSAGWNDPDRVHDTIDMTRPYVVFWRNHRIVGNLPTESYVGLLPYDSFVEGRCEFIVN